jgi:subtilisin-like proprotein convertase family protein
MPTIKGISIKGAACVCTVAILALPGAVQAPPLPQDLPGQDQVGVPSWQTPDQRDVSRSLYITTSSASRFLAAHSGFQAAVGPEVTIVARTADGEMVKADLLDDAHFVDGVGSKTVIEVSHALYGEATLEVLLPQGREVWVEVIFYGPNRASAVVQPQAPLLSNLAPAGGVAAAHPACPGLGDCCADNGTPGCDDVDCCNLICDLIDPFCCDSFWDSLCAGAAQTNCGDLCAIVGCPLDCPPDALDEGEPCGSDTNGGCNSVPPVFTVADCGDTFCGTSWALGGTRDTDWYLVAHGGGPISGILTSQFPGTCFIVDGIDNCAPAVIGAIGCADQCANIAAASADVGPGNYVVFVSPGDCAGGGIFDGIPCGSGANDYVIEITCEVVPPCQSDDDCPPGQECIDGECVPISVSCDCPPDGLEEGEPCGSDTNGGCNSSPPVFTNASCGDTYCGTGWAAGGTRDTDWYLVAHGGGLISGILASNFPGTCFIVDGIDACAPVVVGDIGCGENCANINVASADLPAGNYVVFVAPGDCAGGGIFDGIPCGGGNNDYVLSIECLFVPPCQSDDDCPPGQVCIDGTCVIPPPTNDLCSDAIALDVPSGGSAQVSGTTIDSTFDDVGTCGTSNTAPGVWYSVIGNGNSILADTCAGASYDTKISVFCGDCPDGGGGGSDCCEANGTPGCDDPECEALICGMDSFCCDVAWDSICADAANEFCEVCSGGAGGLICVDGNDDFCGLQSGVEWCAKAGAKYLILVHGFSSGIGTFTLTVSDNGQGCTPDPDCPVVCQSDDDCPPGFACIDGDCVPIPTGACCQCDGSDQFCTIETEDDCLALGGQYLGDGTDCSAGGDLVVVESSPNLPIPDDSVPGIFDTISMGTSFEIVDLEVDLVINHTWLGDLCVKLSKDGGPEIELINQMNLVGGVCDATTCCGCSSNDMDIILDDEGDGPIEDQCGAGGGLLTGTWIPNEPLSTYVGGDSAGDWTINVNDNAGGDTGTLVTWSLHFTQPAGGSSPCEDAGHSCNEPPDCSGAYASVDVLWPANHKYNAINVLGVTDADGDPVTITITGIFQDEALNAQGDGNTCPDATGVGTDTAHVRAERVGPPFPGDGRVYHIYFLADDGQGGECEGTVTVCVPHDLGQGSECVDQGPLYDSTDCNGVSLRTTGMAPSDATENPPNAHG